MTPEKITIKTQSRCLKLVFAGKEYELSFEFLRVHSPSAEVRGHGVGNKKLQVAKKDVVLLNAIPAGNYALKLVFDDGHDSGLYDWAYLKYLCDNKTKLWDIYLAELEQARQSRSTNQIAFKSL